jgi:hypothetical protein
MNYIKEPITFVIDELKVTESLLLASPVGATTLDTLKKALQKKLLKGNVKDYLKKWQNAAQEGTCYGQAVALMIADKGAKKGEESAIIERANRIDSLCFQMLWDLKIDIERKRRSSSKKFKKAREFGKKIHLLCRTLTAKHAQLEFVEKKHYSVHKRDKLINKLKKLIEKKEEHVVQLSLYDKYSGHTVALFLGPRLSVYDSENGLSAALEKEAFLEKIRSVYLTRKYGLEVSELEIYKRKT